VYHIYPHNCIKIPLKALLNEKSYFMLIYVKFILFIAKLKKVKVKLSLCFN